MLRAAALCRRHTISSETPVWRLEWDCLVRRSPSSTQETERKKNIRKYFVGKVQHKFSNVDNVDVNIVVAAITIVVVVVVRCRPLVLAQTRSHVQRANVHRVCICIFEDCN